MIRRLTLNLLADMLLIVLAADLLYLYFAGVWADPYSAIEIAELVILILLIPFGGWRFVKHTREANSD